jgi:hypothetical protein
MLKTLDSDSSSLGCSANVSARKRAVFGGYLKVARLEFPPNLAIAS